MKKRKLSWLFFENRKLKETILIMQHSIIGNSSLAVTVDYL